MVRNRVLELFLLTQPSSVPELRQKQHCQLMGKLMATTLKSTAAFQPLALPSERGTFFKRSTALFSQGSNREVGEILTNTSYAVKELRAGLRKNRLSAFLRVSVSFTPTCPHGPPTRTLSVV